MKPISSKNLIQNERKVNREETSRKLGLSWINFPESLLKSRHLGRQLVFLTRVLLTYRTVQNLNLYSPQFQCIPHGIRLTDERTNEK